MRKKLIFTGMMLLALVLTGGAFAYTYSGIASVTLNSAAAAEAIATQEPSAGQPDWNSVLPEAEYESEILLPNGDGDDTNINYQYPDSGNHWDKVDETTPDDLLTYVYTKQTSLDRDLYNLTDSQLDEGTITGITVYFRIAASDGTTAGGRAVIKTGGTVYQGVTVTQTGGFDTKAYTWTTNPKTKLPWTTADLNALQAGVAIQADTAHDFAYCTMVYVEVQITLPPIIEGAVPEDDLFVITPHPAYTGDLMVKVYLTNTGYLNLAYKYLNMELYMANSLEAGKTPNYQMLTFENGVAIFNIEGSAAASYTIEVIGGSYRLVSGDTSEWGAGWTVIPDLYCEVSQR